MRMWMIDPRRMCDKHVLGEHVECHMLDSSIRKKKSLKGYLEKNLIEPQNIKSRHDQLAKEMMKRGMEHNSPIQQPPDAPFGSVDRMSSILLLASRCERCRLKMRETTPKGMTNLHNLSVCKLTRPDVCSRCNKPIEAGTRCWELRYTTQFDTIRGRMKDVTVIEHFHENCMYIVARAFSYFDPKEMTTNA